MKMVWVELGCEPEKKNPILNGAVRFGVFFVVKKKREKGKGLRGTKRGETE